MSIEIGQTVVYIVTRHEKGFSAEVAGQPLTGVSFNTAREIAEWFGETIGHLPEPPPIANGLQSPVIDVEQIAARIVPVILDKIKIPEASGITKEQRNEIIADTLRHVSFVLKNKPIHADGNEVTFDAATAGLDEIADKITGKGPKTARIKE